MHYMHSRFTCAFAGRQQQARLAYARRALDHQQPPAPADALCDSGANDLQLCLALDELLRSGDSHAAIVIMASFRVKFRVLTP